MDKWISLIADLSSLWEAYLKRQYALYQTGFLVGNRNNDHGNFTSDLYAEGCNSRREDVGRGNKKGK
jgi:hypothetical protein